VTPPALEDLLARLQRYEQRTAALEAALFEAQPTQLAIARTATAGADETAVAAKPKRDVSGERVSRTPKPPVPSSSTVSPLTVLGSLDDVVWSVSPDGQFVFFVGGAVERLYGVTEHELDDERGRWLDALPPADRPRLCAALARLPDSGTFTLEHQIEHASDTRRWAVTRGKLVRDRDGRPLRVDGITTDVTRTARTREAVLAVLEGTGAATGPDFLTKLVRHLCGACEVRTAVVIEPHPHEPNEARTTAAWIDGRFVEPVALGARAGLVRDLLAGGGEFVPSGARERYPTDPLLLRLRAEAFAAEPLVDGAGRLLGFVALADDRPFATETDVRTILKALAPRAAVEVARAHEQNEPNERDTQLRDTEQRLADTETLLRGAADLAAAGRMAAGVAHDFNNLLGVIVGNADLIREALPDGHVHRETAEAIARAAQTVAGVSRKLLSVGRPGAPHLAPLDIAGALQTLEPVLRRLVGRVVQFDVELPSSLPPVRADATQFDRVVLNLVLNARDAVEAKTGSRGTVNVRAALAVVEPDRAGWPADRAPGRYVALTVSDTGCGMTPEVREKMFRTFFTTKGARGTGLGLVTVSEAVAAARGHIEVESRPDWGTQIRVYWPTLRNDQ
jgi:signal transduction histidine kinase/PAS domain-containing protein